MSAVVRFEQVSKRYRGHTVLNGLDLSLAAGEVLVVRGPSGIGKSTLLRLTAGLERPSSGRVILTTRRIGFVFQEPRLLPWRTALENVVLPLRAAAMDTVRAQEAARGMLARMGLGGFEDAYPEELSGGMRQRVSLARALAVEPELLLLDEPFTGLDPELRTSVRRQLDDFLEQSGAAALYVTHDMGEIPAAARRILYIEAMGAVFARFDGVKRRF